MNKYIILLFFIKYIFGLKALEHQCIHDEMYQSYQQESFPSDDQISDSRNLQNKKARNMVITYDMSYFQRLAQNQQNKQLIDICEKAIKLANSYFSQLIKIIPKSELDMRYKPTSFTKCGEFEIPQKDKVKGKESDLHIYVQYKNEPQQSYMAYANRCQFIERLGPTHGQVTFNFSKLETKDLNDPIQFKDLMQIVIHEMTHILGFSYADIPKWVNSEKNHHTEPTIQQKLRGIDTLFLKTPHVLQFARRYFNCPTLVGMPLENLGENSSKNSHWKTTVIENEYMNASVSTTQAYFSGFTANLLRDTGFYAEIKESMEEQIYYGKGAGCQHVTGQCDSNKREYCNPKTDDGLCDYYHLASSECKLGQFNEPNCNTFQIFHNAKCWDVNSNLNKQGAQNVIGVKFGNDSRCFNSSLRINEYKSQKATTQISGECYKYECNSNGTQVSIYVGKTKVKVVCTKNLEKMTVKGYQGTIVCPENINYFCGFKKFCPNFCSANGFCLNNKCNCANKYIGNDCSFKIPI
ncbi:leishmanolysin family protein, putative [Ichthyophthirius multifiliis]|uniref:Leishmanolysin family protein, putative n=1 Tax=Ichthyophthirius multifiliis TaxID=5932 RepID=G0QLB6_ICHMU|nr:leishmanolysin family protein, putative [Ichthyophthirius multifiliis]EGR33990.1 leishmanolysin family protein, putative [Ichthyophthirius multifiliis]|eukprot:XP_004039294.1 leishmanolysin family protein, putative [Ichthyophthirius multifiliis]